MWGLQERAVAAASLEGFAAQLTRCKAGLLALLPTSEHSAVDTFYARTVDAAGCIPQLYKVIGVNLA